MTVAQQGWKIAGLAVLPIRFVQGWIFWGGGSRRFIYDPSKLDPYANSWMANKFQSAMPGAILGMSHVISFMLQHFVLLYMSVILFSLAELLSGLALITGCFTRFAAFMTVLISIVLMIAFGWQGATCMDEWTMAAATFGLGMTLMLSGASAYSIDNVIGRHYPALAKRRWFRLLASGPLDMAAFKRITKICLVFTVAFTLLTYNYYRGSIFTPYHDGPVSASTHDIALSNGVLKSNGAVTFTMYVNAGTPALPSHIIRAELLNLHNDAVAVWTGQALSQIVSSDINNVYAYNRIQTGPYGLVAPMSAKATVTLIPNEKVKLAGNNFKLVLFTISGHRYEMLMSVN
jgi:thiosulfate dehydrogenase [quinone] large subunit